MKETGMQRLFSEVRKRRRNQKGFTLIEMLVVISILGILAAIVTLSMVGITNLAQQHANDTELKTVQTALDAMAAQQQLSASSICSGTAAKSNDMGSFPDGAGQGTQSTGTKQALWPTYIRTEFTSRSYTCDGNGIVHDAGAAPPSPPTS
jgi:prepilin-type N-terminal cleavage/methylation domain-containing protein